MGAEQIWDRLPKAPFCYLGWGLFSIWNSLAYRLPPTSISAIPEKANIAYEVVSLVVLAGLALGARLVPRFAPLWRHRWALPLATLLLIGCTCINYSMMLMFVTSSLLAWVALFAGGFGTALMMMLTSEFFGYVHPRRTVLYMSLGWLTGAIVTMFARVLPLSYLWTVMCLTPPVIALCLWRSYRTLSESELACVSNGEFPFPWAPLVPIALSVVLKEGVTYLAPTTLDAGVTSDIGMACAAIVILAGLTLYGGDLNLRSIWKVGAGTMGASVALLCLAAVTESGWAGSGAVILATASYAMLFILMAAIIANMSYRYGFCAL